jgi:hypothetical protein
MGGPCSTHEEAEKYVEHFVWKVRKRPFGRTSRRWEDNINPVLVEIGQKVIGEFVWIG